MMELNEVRSLLFLCRSGRQGMSFLLLELRGCLICKSQDRICETALTVREGIFFFVCCFPNPFFGQQSQWYQWCARLHVSAPRQTAMRPRRSIHPCLVLTMLSNDSYIYIYIYRPYYRYWPWPRSSAPSASSCARLIFQRPLRDGPVNARPGTVHN